MYTEVLPFFGRHLVFADGRKWGSSGQRRDEFGTAERGTARGETPARWQAKLPVPPGQT